MNKKDWHQIVRGLGLLTQIGIIMIVNIGVGFFLGYLLDNYLGFQLVLKMIGLLLGIISGFYSNYRIIRDVFSDKGG
ncbi:MAG: AtpZ/AtpI family protein [Halanaerobiaceae bacterium]